MNAEQIKGWTEMLRAARYEPPKILPPTADERVRQAIAAERNRIRNLIAGKRNEFADHARQARALPKTAETLALKADTLSEVLDLLGDDRP